MASSRALCSRSGSCIGPITASRQRRLTVAFRNAVPDLSRQVHDDIFESAFDSRRTSRFDAKAKSKPDGPEKPSEWRSGHTSRPQTPGPRFATSKPADEGESAMDIFKDVVDGKKGDQAVGEGQVTDLTLTAVLRQVAQKDMAPRQRVDFFFKDVWPAVVAKGRPLPKNTFIDVRAALKRVTNTLFTEPGYKQVKFGDLTNIAKAIQWLGTNDVPAIAGLIVGLCFLTQKNVTSRVSKMTHKGAAAMVPGNARNPELLQLWGYLSSMNRTSAHGDQDGPPSLKMPKIEDVVKITDKLYKETADSVTALTALLNQFPVNTAKQAFPAVMATLDVLLLKAPAALLPQWAPLLDSARHVLTEFPVEDLLLRQHFANTVLIPPTSQGEIARGVAQRWPETYAMLTAENPIWRFKDGEQPIRKRTNVTLKKLEKDLKAAHESYSTGILMGLWKEVQAHVRSSEALAAEVRQKPEYIDYWHFCWCAAKQSHMVSETQALMKTLNLEPTIKTYTSMMHGWKQSRETERINMLWESLQKAGFPLDTFIWTERISGLIELGESQKGINTLAEMMGLWTKAVETGTQDKAVPVSITVINAAFKPLIRRDRQAAFKILQWAGREGIKPDVYTYNILLRECFRKAESSENVSQDVNNLLTAMKNEHIEPDSATFTIILEGVCQDLSHAPAQEQVEAVDQVIQDMHTARVNFNLEVWGKLLYTVSHFPSSSEAVINKVLARMREHGIVKISAHMVHILVQRLMRQDQAKPEAVEKLLLENGYPDVTSGDQRMWEEVISAYSYMGDGQRAMAVYKDLRRVGRRMDRQTATRDFLAALLGSGDREGAKLLVDDALADCRDDVGSNDRSFRTTFWGKAYDEGLVDWEKAPTALQQAVDPGRLIRAGA